MRRSILYFDDDVVCLDVFESMFDDEYDIRTASVLSEARRILSAFPVEVVISDQQMPEISGTEFLCEVAGLYPSSYRIMMTGSMTVGEAIPELSSGIVHLFMPKPWKEQDIRKALEHANFQLDLRGMEH